MALSIARIPEVQEMLKKVIQKKSNTDLWELMTKSQTTLAEMNEEQQRG